MKYINAMQKTFCLHQNEKDEFVCCKFICRKCKYKNKIGYIYVDNINVRIKM